MNERPPFFDTHAHLDFPDFAPDLPAVIDRAAAAGITRIVSIATDLASARRAVALSSRFPGVYAAAGWHPGHAAEAPDDIRAELRELAASPKVVAIGECGLDYHRLPAGAGGDPSEADAVKRLQATLFRQQLEVADETGLSLVIHTRDSFADTLALMAPFQGRVRAVFHCFAEGPDEMRQAVAAGHWVSFTGIATFKNAGRMRDTIEATPLDRLMLETDCPFLAPVPHRGKRCEPAYVADLAPVVAALKKVTLAELSEATCANARAFFRGLE